ncbi:MAG: MmgE/PrpD family protein [Paracoccaceae bacterium]|nr:MmgE/PrpD family protein [Paracoccaceae bacterium]
MSIETTDRLVDHVLSASIADLSPHDVEKAKIFLLDTLGVGIAGSSGASVEQLLSTVQSWGAGDEATVWVTGERVSAQAAAMVNAYQIHCLEYDCVHEGAVVHPMATVLSTMIAYAERRSAAGRPVPGCDFLMAMILGVDVAAYMGMAATGPVRFFRPATAGGLGATAAIARLEGLDATGMKDALGNMYGQTCGTLQPHAEGSPLLGLQIGFNARGALSALDLAAAGFRGPHDIVDGQYGYLPMFEAGQFDLDIIWRDLGRVWQMSELSHKPFPSGRLTHGVIDALNRVINGKGVAPDEILKITAYVPPLVHRLVGRPDVPEPEPNYAKLCLAYVAGAYMTRGQVDVPEFRSEEVLRDPALHAHAAKVEVVLDDNPDENALDPQRFVFELADGTVEEVDIPHMFGHPRAALTVEENRAKFDRCVTYGRRALSRERADRIAGAVGAVEELADAAELARMTVADRTE